MSAAVGAAAADDTQRLLSGAGGGRGSDAKARSPRPSGSAAGGSAGGGGGAVSVSVGPSSAGAGDRDSERAAWQPDVIWGTGAAPPNPSGSRALRAIEAASAFKDSLKGVSLAVLIIVLLAVCGSFLALNAWKLHLFVAYHAPPPPPEGRPLQCAQPFPMWLLVSGVSGTVGVALMLWFGVSIGLGSVEGWNLILNVCACGVVILFDLVWLILGSVWLYGTDRFAPQCPAPVFDFVFYYVTLAWALIGLPFVFCFFAMFFTWIWPRDVKSNVAVVKDHE